jgi:predicted DNA repair protein MutK
MKGLSVAGTAAMFLVGGGILVHGLPPLHHAVQALAATGEAALGWLLEALANAAVGMLAGAAALALMAGLQRLRPKPATASGAD